MTKPILATATVPGSVDRHIVRATRYYESDGAATKHEHSGTTLCGAKIKEFTPFIPATYAVKSRFRCESCCEVYYDGKY